MVHRRRKGNGNVLYEREKRGDQAMGDNSQDAPIANPTPAPLNAKCRSANTPWARKWVREQKKDVKRYLGEIAI